MKRWAIVVAILYGLILLALTSVGMLVAWPLDKVGLQGLMDTYTSWIFWSLLLLLVLSQAALLAVPVRMAQRRPVTRGAVWPTILAGGLAAGLLAFGAAAAIFGFAFGDEQPGEDGEWTVRIALAAGVLLWAVWTFVFYRWARSLTSADLLARQRKGLFRGSILELLVAVPTHIVVRQRDTCCADGITFVGIVCGMAVMLFAYGPAVFFLFAARWRRLHPHVPDLPDRVGGPAGR